MKTQQHKAKQFTLLHEQAGCFIIPNPWNAGTAKLLEQMGFKALATTSAGLAFSLGVQDVRQIILREVALENARSIVEATDLPVSADLEDGFGSTPEAVASTIRMAGEIGLVGGSIEDATGDDQSPVYDFELAVERIAAAVEAKNNLNFPFILTARSENFIYGFYDLDDTIRRLQAYQEAGADVLYAPDVSKYEDIKTIIDSVDKPVNILITSDMTVSHLAEIGVKRISVGSSMARAALGAFLGAAKELMESGTCLNTIEAVSYCELMERFDK